MEVIIFFILLPIILIFAVARPLTVLKQDYLPVNLNATAKEVINTNLNVKDYVFSVYGRYLFVFYPIGKHNGNEMASWDIARKGEKSGYIFKIYGIQLNFSRQNIMPLMDDNIDVGTIYLRHSEKDEYIIVFGVNDEKNYSFVDTMNSKFETLSENSVSEKLTICVINHISTNYRVFLTLNNKKIEILNYAEIKGLVG